MDRHARRAGPLRWPAVHRLRRAHAILDLAEDAAGSLWIATKRGLYRQQGGEFHRFTTADGLLHNYVADVCPARDGGLWVATQGGVDHFRDGRFSGHPFAATVRDGANPPFLSHEVFSLAEDAAGEVWAGTRTGLCRLDRTTGRFTTERRDRVPLAEDQQSIVRAAWVDRTGPLWFGTDELLVKRSGAAAQEFRFEPDASDTRLRRILQDRSGTVWAVRAGKVYQVRGEALVRFDATVGLADTFITDLLEDPQGGLWVATRYAGLHQLTPAPLRVFTTKDGLSHNTVVSVSPSRDGGLWVATARGLMRFRDGRFGFPVADLPVRELNCRAVFEDRAGDVWVSYGLRRLDEPTGEAAWLEPFSAGFRYHPIDVAPQEPAAFFEDRQERLWIGGRSGLACLLTDRPASPETSRKRATRWLREPDRLLHIDGTGGHLEVRAGQWRLALPEHAPWFPLASLPAEALAGLPLPVAQPLSSYDVRALHEDRAGTLWFGTGGGGLNRLRDGRLDVLTTRDGLAGDFIQALFEDSEGVLWIGTTTGLTRMSVRSSRGDEALTNSAFRVPSSEFDLFTFREQHGLPDDEVNQILEDDAGHLWIGCRQGIYRVARAELTAVAAGRAARADCRLFDEDDGLLAGETNNGAQPTACKTPDGNLWFATPQGLVMIDPRTVTPRIHTPLVFLETLRAGTNGFSLLDAPGTAWDRRWREAPAEQGGAHSLGGSLAPPVGHLPDSKLETSNSELRLAPGSGRSLEIAFTALDYAAPDKLRFRYRLAGHDDDWTEAGPRRVAYYTNLRPRAYRFTVQAAGRDHRWTEPGQTIGFTLAPFFWQTAWFQGACGMTGAAALALLVAWRVREVRRVQGLQSAAALARQRESIARDLHDDLGSRLAQISLLGELSARDPAQAARVFALAREAAQNLDGLVWTVHPERDSLDHLAAYLSQFAHEFLAPTGLELELDLPPTIPALPLSALVRKAVLLATKEALHNIVQHAAARHVRLAFELGDHAFTVTVEDDGCGLWQGGGLESPPSREHGLSSPQSDNLKLETSNLQLTPPSAHGHGLENIRRRLAEIGGRCDFGPRPGGGTRVSLSVPLPTHPA